MVRYKVWAKIEIEKIVTEVRTGKETYDNEEMPLPVPLGVFDTKREAVRFAEDFDTQNAIDTPEVINGDTTR